MNLNVKENKLEIALIILKRQAPYSATKHMATASFELTSLFLTLHAGSLASDPPFTPALIALYMKLLSTSTSHSENLTERHIILL